MIPELNDFLAQWTEDANNVRPLFIAMHDALVTLPGVELDYKARPGVSHSLRAKHAAQHDRSLFVLVDIIDDNPSARWLSVCFYADLVDDPEEKGDVVPGGLSGEDARCFDIDEGTEIRDYMLARLNAAAALAGQSKNND